MKLVMPQEVEVWYVIPALRREFALLMLKKGLTQNKIADKLGVTEAAVSQYIKSKRASSIKFDNKIELEIENSVNKIVNNLSNTIREIQNICNILRTNKSICELHHTYNKEVPTNCDECFVK